MLDPNELDDETIALIMESVQVGIQHGLNVAESRLKGEFLIEPLSWEIVRKGLERDDQS